MFELLITCARRTMTDKKSWSGKSGAELALAAELFPGLWWSPATPATERVVYLGTPNSLRMPEEAFLLLYDLVLLPTTTQPVQQT